MADKATIVAKNIKVFVFLPDISDEPPEVSDRFSYQPSYFPHTYIKDWSVVGSPGVIDPNLSHLTSRSDISYYCFLLLVFSSRRIFLQNKQFFHSEPIITDIYGKIGCPKDDLG